MNSNDCVLFACKCGAPFPVGDVGASGLIASLMLMLSILLFIEAHAAAALFFLAVTGLLLAFCAQKIRQYSRTHASLQLLPDEIRSVRENGETVRRIALSGILEIRTADGAPKVLLKRRPDPHVPEERGKEFVWETLDGVKKAAEFVTAARAQLLRMQEEQEAQLIASQSVPAVPQTDAEAAADTRHAADQLLMAGKITQAQYDVMTGKAEPFPAQLPQSADAVDMQNAADFMQRNERIAQQMRAEQEDGTHERTGLI